MLITRKVDSNDDNVSFVIDWIREFSKQIEGGKLVVICQEKGEVPDFPDHVEVHSFGKERGFGRWRQFTTLTKHVYKNIRKVDAVFCHMIPHYSVVAGPWCFIFRKPLLQWYMHKSVNWILKLSSLFVDGYVTASRESFRMPTRRPVYIFGHGISTEKFDDADGRVWIKNNVVKLLTVGRVSPIKNVDKIVEAVKLLREKDYKVELDVVGGPGMPSQQSYYNDIKTYIDENDLKPLVRLHGSIPHDELAAYYLDSDICINLSETGSLDKVTLEAMLMKRLVVTSNDAFAYVVPPMMYLEEADAHRLAHRIEELLRLNKNNIAAYRTDLREIVLNQHSLPRLILKILTQFKKIAGRV